MSYYGTIGTNALSGSSNSSGNFNWGAWTSLLASGFSAEPGWVWHSPTVDPAGRPVAWAENSTHGFTVVFWIDAGYSNLYRIGRTVACEAYDFSAGAVYRPAVRGTGTPSGTSGSIYPTWQSLASLSPAVAGTTLIAAAAYGSQVRGVFINEDLFTYSGSYNSNASAYDFFIYYAGAYTPWSPAAAYGLPFVEMVGGADYGGDDTATNDTGYFDKAGTPGMPNVAGLPSVDFTHSVAPWHTCAAYGRDVYSVGPDADPVSDLILHRPGGLTDGLGYIRGTLSGFRPGQHDNAMTGMTMTDPLGDAWTYIGYGTPARNAPPEVGLRGWYREH